MQRQHCWHLCMSGMLCARWRSLACKRMHAWCAAGLTNAHQEVLGPGSGVLELLCQLVVVIQVSVWQVYGLQGRHKMSSCNPIGASTVYHFAYMPYMPYIQKHVQFCKHLKGPCSWKADGWVAFALAETRAAPERVSATSSSGTSGAPFPISFSQGVTTLSPGVPNTVKPHYH